MPITQPGKIATKKAGSAQTSAALAASARVVAARLGIPDGLRQDLRHADEMTARVKVRDDAPAIGQSLRELSLPTETGMWVIAIRRDVDWVYGPDGDEVLREGDVLFLQGPREGVDAVRSLAGGTPHELPPPPEGAALSNLDRAVDLVVELKNVSEVAIGLAYSALLFNDQSLAAEVSHLEDRLDEMRERLEV